MEFHRYAQGVSDAESQQAVPNEIAFFHFRDKL
jgi:hypothetical protein